MAGIVKRCEKWYRLMNGPFKCRNRLKRNFGVFDRFGSGCQCGACVRGLYRIPWFSGLAVIGFQVTGHRSHDVVVFFWPLDKVASQLPYPRRGANAISQQLSPVHKTLRRKEQKKSENRKNSQNSRMTAGGGPPAPHGGHTQFLRGGKPARSLQEFHSKVRNIKKQLRKDASEGRLAAKCAAKIEFSDTCTGAELVKELKVKLEMAKEQKLLGSVVGGDDDAASGEAASSSAKKGSGSSQLVGAGKKNGDDDDDDPNRDDAPPELIKREKALREAEVKEMAAVAASSTEYVGSPWASRSNLDGGFDAQVHEEEQQRTHQCHSPDDSPVMPTKSVRKAAAEAAASAAGVGAGNNDTRRSLDFPTAAETAAANAADAANATETTGADNENATTQDDDEELIPFDQISKRKSQTPEQRAQAACMWREVQLFFPLILRDSQNNTV